VAKRDNNLEKLCLLPESTENGFLSSADRTGKQRSVRNLVRTSDNIQPIRERNVTVLGLLEPDMLEGPQLSSFAAVHDLGRCDSQDSLVQQRQTDISLH